MAKKIIITAPYSGSGKTTATIGIMDALVRMGLSVQPFKVGPDYIDPAFHKAVTGRPSINLDNWLIDENYIKNMFTDYGKDSDISVIEGVMGFYDGYGTENIYSGSTAGICRLLGAPPILVMDAHGMAATAAAIVKGIFELGGFDKGGVIINKVTSLNHYNILKKVIESHTGISVIGCIPDDPEVKLHSRHLGLIQSLEIEELQWIIKRLGDMVKDNVDLNMLLQISSQGKDIVQTPIYNLPIKETGLKIAVAYDRAFSFYYEENFNILKRMGCRLCFFSPLSDKKLPDDVSGIYIGGGYPEVFAETLSQNREMLIAIKKASEMNMPIYGECGGYMYLNNSIITSDIKEYEMTSIFPGKAVMTERLQNFGYTEVTCKKDNILMKKGDKVRGHEFHKSKIIREDEDFYISMEKRRNGFLKQWQCGSMKNNTFGMYPHIYFPSNINIAKNFINSCQKFNKVITKGGENHGIY